MQICNNVVFIILVSSILVACCSRNGNEQHNDSKYGKTEYFTRVDLKFTPAKVFDDISDEDLPTHIGSYYEASFTPSGLISKIRHLHKKDEFWVICYKYSETGKLIEETWLEDGKTRIRKF